MHGQAYSVRSITDKDNLGDAVIAFALPSATAAVAEAKRAKTK
jgi:hypothetical protein